MPKLIPFDPSIHKPKDIGFGGPSTEFLVTIDSPDGQVMVVPSIWWDEEGNPQLLGDIEKIKNNEWGIDEDAVRNMVKDYEKETGYTFPRFGKAGVEDNYKLADLWAQERSKAGGASEVPIKYSFTDLELDPDLFKGSF